LAIAPFAGRGEGFGGLIGKRAWAFGIARGEGLIFFALACLQGRFTRGGIEGGALRVFLAPVGFILGRGFEWLRELGGNLGLGRLDGELRNSFGDGIGCDDRRNLCIRFFASLLPAGEFLQGDQGRLIGESAGEVCDVVVEQPDNQTEVRQEGDAYRYGPGCI